MATEINNPTLAGVTLPFPSAASINPEWIMAEHTTLGGRTRRQVMARKYSYVLTWDFMRVSDYNALETEINIQTNKTFVYDKWPQSASPGVLVLASLSARELQVGAGDSNFLSSVTLTLIEVNSRI